MSTETGHYVNQSNFTLIVNYCESKAGAFNPALVLITLVKLLAKKITIKDAMTLFGKKAAEWGKKVNDRDEAYKPVNKLMTRVRNAVEVSDVTDDLKKDVHGIVNEILGVRESPKLKMTPEDPTVPTDESIKQISAAQTGFDNKLGNVIKLKNVLELETNYAPNEDEIKVTAIDALITDLTDKNDAVSAATPPMKYAMEGRNKELYDSVSGGNELASKIKKYFKAAYGSNSVDYHFVAKLKFVKLGKV
jgi:hypothetical protein